MKKLPMEEPCEILEWDSRFFEKKFAKVRSEKLTAADVMRIFEWCEAQNVDCLYFFADPNCLETSLQAEKNQFHLVDVRVSLEKKLHCEAAPGAISLPVVRGYQPKDFSQLRKMGSDLFTKGRFYFDPQIPSSRADTFYQKWIEVCCEENPDAVWVVEIEDRIAGFVACRPREGLSNGRIVLLGIRPQYRGAGLGRLLAWRCLNWFILNGDKSVEVVTQGRNAEAQRFFQSLGFFTKKIQLSYHRWFVR